MPERLIEALTEVRPQKGMGRDVLRQLLTGCNQLKGPLGPEGVDPGLDLLRHDRDVPSHIAAAKEIPVDEPLLPVGLGASDHAHRFSKHGTEESISAVHRQLFIGLLKEEFMICRSHQNYHGLWAEPEAKDGTAGGISPVEHLHTVAIKGGQMAQQGYAAWQQRRKREQHGSLLEYTSY